MCDESGRVYTVDVGTWIVERRKGSTPKRIHAIHGDRILCESRAGRLTWVASRNLGRYQCIPYRELPMHTVP